VQTEQTRSEVASGAWLSYSIPAEQGSRHVYEGVRVKVEMRKGGRSGVAEKEEGNNNNKNNNINKRRNSNNKNNKKLEKKKKMRKPKKKKRMKEEQTTNV
jgi:hypothetical protein